MHHLVRDVFPERMSVSFEFFPPKEEQPIEPVLSTISTLRDKWNPDFMSVTYGAGGTNKGRNLELCAAIEKLSVPAVSHFTCIGNTREFIVDQLKALKENGIENILTLRGDLPAGWTGTNGDFSYAVDLAAFIKKTDPSFCLAGAISPEVHMRAKSLDHDIMYARRKKDAGVDFFMTQLFYDNDAFYRYRDRLYGAGADLPIDVGVMPVLKKDAIIKMTLMNGSAIPVELARIIGIYGDNPDDFKKAGMEYTVKHIADLVSNGIDGLHMFTLNKWEDVSEILTMAGVCF